MIDLSARSMLFDLRVIRRLLQDERSTLGVTDHVELALNLITRMIERIEDFDAFYKALCAAASDSSSEADLGEGFGVAGGDLGGGRTSVRSAGPDGPPGSV